MPVDSRHPEYEEMCPKWERMRDVLAGEDAVKEAADKYLPRLSSANGATPLEKTQQYEGYKSRAQFFGATARALQSLQGFIFRKDPTVTVPDALAPFMADSTLQGLSFYDVTKETVHQVLAVGRRGTLIDFDEGPENRPYLVSYRAEDIINWRVERVGGQMTLTLLVLFEQDGEFYDLGGSAAISSPKKASKAAVGAAMPPDEFEQTLYEQWRVFRLVQDDAGQPFVRCTIYRKKDPETKGGKAEFVAVADLFPSRRGVALDRLPFVFHGPNHSQPCPDRVPLEDMALVNLSMYRTSADLENGRHICGIPTPWAAGFVDQSDGGATKELLLGSNVAWTSPQPDAKCGFLEFTGQGLGALEKAIEQKKGEMAALGARMLEPEAKKAEAFETVAVRAAAETSALMNATVSCTQSLSAVLRWVAWWLGTQETPEAVGDTAKTELNTEFTVMTLDAPTLTALTAAYLGGAIDFESFCWKLQQGEMLPPDADFEKIRANIEANPPGLPLPEPPPGAAA